MKNIEYPTQCSRKTWTIAQQFEEKCWNSTDTTEDWNRWWKNKFDNYSFLQPYNISSVCEVGCGPFAKNIQLIIGNRNNINKKILLDPLLDTYIRNKKSVVDFIDKKTILYSMPLEEVPKKETVDLIICINTLGHTYDANKCLQNIFEMLNPHGIIILGEDVTDNNDMTNYKTADIGHPIRMNIEFFENQMLHYQSIFKKILPREEGRNPNAHGSTFLFAGIKK